MIITKQKILLNGVYVLIAVLPGAQKWLAKKGEREWFFFLFRVLSLRNGSIVWVSIWESVEHGVKLTLFILSLFGILHRRSDSEGTFDICVLEIQQRDWTLLNTRGKPLGSLEYWGEPQKLHRCCVYCLVHIVVRVRLLSVNLDGWWFWHLQVPSKRRLMHIFSSSAFGVDSLRHQRQLRAT